ncbi:MAG: type II toxin-antitoxin system HicB family antitoxin [Betaproteobacteria bacterium]|nr:type II toxin-antitoxin system HicB family antitoxin [Betaproteobacteria bacterium]
MTTNTMTHKGYIARIEFDDSDGIFVGRILGTRDIISFHADTVAKLRKEMKAAVDDYLAYCQERGIAPDKPASGQLMLRVPSEVHAAANIAAQAAGKSLNQWATEVLKQATHL